MYHVYINRDIIYLSIFLFSILIERFPHDTSLLREEGEEAEGEPQDGPEAEGGSVFSRCHHHLFIHSLCRTCSLARPEQPPEPPQLTETETLVPL